MDRPVTIQDIKDCVKLLSEAQEDQRVLPCGGCGAELFLGDVVIYKGRAYHEHCAVDEITKGTCAMRWTDQ